MAKLPQLLAALPSSGRSALVRPTTWPENSFYQITRTKLKFRLDSASNHGESSKSESSMGASRSSSNLSGDVEALKESLKSHKITAGGKAWGMLFWKGKLVTRKSPIAAADSLIRGGLKRRWLAIDASSLDAATRAVLESAENLRREKDVARKEEIQRRREAKKERAASQAALI